MPTLPPHRSNSWGGVPSPRNPTALAILTAWVGWTALAPHASAAANVVDQPVWMRPDAPCVKAAPPDEAGSDNPALPSDEALEQFGARIGEVRIDNLDIFDTRLQEEDNAAFRLANALHIKTKRQTLVQQLLFKPGDLYSARLLRESERALRANGYLGDASIRACAFHDGVVDLQVSTQDVWTLKPGVSLGRKGGHNSSSIGIQETNFLGLGKQLGVDVHSGVDRTTKTLSYQDTQLFGSRWALSGEYDDSSDGRGQMLSLDHPFYALDTRQAMGASLRNESRTDSVYQQGQIVSQYATRDRRATAYTGWSDGLQNGSALRWTTGLSLDERHYATLDAGRTTAELPEDRKLIYPWIGLAWIEDQYEATRNQDQIGKTEDIALGWNVRGRFGLASSHLGSDRSAGIFSASASKGWRPTPAETYLMSASAEGRLEGEGLRGGLLNLSARYYLRQSARRSLFASFTVDRGVHLDADQQILLGGDSGLRGYPLRYQRGTGRWLASIEQRAFSDWYPLRLFRVGGAVFYDMGRTWDGPSPADSAQGLLRDIGFGLRLGNSRSGLGTVVHVDAAFPLDGDKTIKKMQLVIEAKRSF